MLEPVLVTLSAWLFLGENLKALQVTTLPPLRQESLRLRHILLNGTNFTNDAKKGGMRRLSP